MILQRRLARLYIAAASLSRASPATQHPLTVANENVVLDPPSTGVSVRLFTTLERSSRLVDIAYCVGSTGLSAPFECASRCQDFPTFKLVTTWHTGVLMSDSCGYIAVAHGQSRGSKDSEPHEGSIVVAFRGTYSIANTVVDLSTIPQEYVPYPAPDDGDGGTLNEELEHKCMNCTVHMGFLTSWKEARKYVLPAIKKLRVLHPNYPIHLVGHSLGGSVAALAALEMKVIQGWDNLTATTFGEPRVGNAGFVKYLDQVFDLKNKNMDPESRTFRRVTHVDDPVPLLPLTDWGYASHAGEVFISKSDLAPDLSDLRVCDGGYDPQCVAGSAGESSHPMERRVVQAAQTMMNGHEKSGRGASALSERYLWRIPARLKLWELFFAHRDYFWRLGLCLPGGDPIDWGRDKYPNARDGGNDEL